jgi:hypothetical protein
MIPAAKFQAGQPLNFIRHFHHHKTHPQALSAETSEGIHKMWKALPSGTHLHHSFPGFGAPLQWVNLGETLRSQLERHTGARGFVWSTAK